MKLLESLKNEMFGKNHSLNKKSMSTVFAGQALGSTKTKGSEVYSDGDCSCCSTSNLVICNSFSK